ncbi:MAG: hypothetical protein ACRESF_11540 [Pseudomonas sp.]
MKALCLVARCVACFLLPLCVLLAFLYAPDGLSFSFLIGASTLTSFKINANVSWQYDLAATGLANPSTDTNAFSFADSTTSGTAAGQADLIYAAQITIAGAGATTININSSPVKDWFGTNIVMVRISYFFINLLTSTTASSVAIGNAANPIVNWISLGTSTIKLQNGGIWVQGYSDATGYVVTMTTADQLKILNNDGTNTATLNVCIVGKSA